MKETWQKSTLCIPEGPSNVGLFLTADYLMFCFIHRNASELMGTSEKSLQKTHPWYKKMQSTLEKSSSLPPMPILSFFFPNFSCRVFPILTTDNKTIDRARNTQKKAFQWHRFQSATCNCTTPVNLED